MFCLWQPRLQATGLPPTPAEQGGKRRLWAEPRRGPHAAATVAAIHKRSPSVYPAQIHRDGPCISHPYGWRWTGRPNADGLVLPGVVTKELPGIALRTNKLRAYEGKSSELIRRGPPSRVGTIQFNSVSSAYCPNVTYLLFGGRKVPCCFCCVEHQLKQWAILQ